MFIAGMCVLAATSLAAIVLLLRHPRLWLLSLGVLATAAGLVLYLPIRTAFDANGDEFGFGIFIEFLTIAAFVGLLHLGLFLILVGSAIEEANHKGRGL